MHCVYAGASFSHQFFFVYTCQNPVYMLEAQHSCQFTEHRQSLAQLLGQDRVLVSLLALKIAYSYNKRRVKQTNKLINVVLY